MRISFRLVQRSYPCLVLLLAGWALSGCLSRPALAPETFALRSPPLRQGDRLQGSGVLALRPVTVSPLFADSSFVYRIGDSLYEHDPYAKFLVAPDRMLAIAIRAHLQQSGAFRDVLEPNSPLKADRVADVYVREFYGDFRKANAPEAVLGARIIVSEAGGPGAFLNQDYLRRVPLKQRTAAALVEGWDQALDQVLTDVTTRLKSAAP
jgi:ABC-type uncharacterized transport system auxiliary subunit